MNTKFFALITVFAGFSAISQVLRPSDTQIVLGDGNPSKPWNVVARSPAQLPSESSLPNRTLPILATSNSPKLPSESTLPRKPVKQSVEPSFRSTEGTVAAGPPSRSIPSESELPTRKPSDSNILIPFAESNAALEANRNAAATPSTDESNRGSLESELLKEEGETTPWPRLIQAGHTAAITAMAFAPDGNALYTAGRDKLVHVWAVDANQNWTHRDTVRWQVGRGPGGNISSVLSTHPFLLLGGYGIKAGREIGVLDRNALTTLSPLLNIADLSARDTEALIDLSTDNESTIVASDSQGGLVRWELNRNTGKWNSTRIRESSNRRTRFAPMARVGNTKMVISETLADQASPTYQLALLDARDGKEIEILTHATATSQGNEILEAMFGDLEKATGKSLLATEKAELVRRILPASGRTCTKIACSPSGHYILTLDDAGWLAIWQSGKGLILKYRQTDVLNGTVLSDSAYAYTTVAWSESEQTFFAGEIQRKTGRGRIQKWVANADGPFRIAKAVDLDKPPFHLSSQNDRLANDNGTQIQIRNLGDLSLLSELGRNAFRAPKQIQWNADGKIAWKWSDMTGAEMAMGIVTNEDGEPRLQSIDPAQRRWLMPPSVPKGELPKYDSKGYLAVLLPNGLKANLSLDVGANETISSRYGQISASCWILDANASPTGLAVSFIDGAEIWAFGFPTAGQTACPLWRVFRGHEDSINALQCSGDGRYLISSSQDRRICCWPLWKWNAALDASLDPIAKWGVQAEIGPDAVEIREVAAEGPLYAKGIREGDRLVKLSWTEPDPKTGKLKADSTEDPKEIWRKLSQANFLTNFAFWVQRGAPDAPRFGFKRVCQWEPLLTAAVNSDRDWAAWTPLGFYDASFNGDQLFGWQLNRGPDKRPDFLPANRFRASLERPDVIGRLLDAGNIVKAFEKVASQIPGGPKGVLSNLIALQPSVEVTVPPTVAFAQGNAVRLRAKVKMQRGQRLLSSRAYVNGVAATDFKFIGPSLGRVDPLETDKRLFVLEWDATIPSDRRLKFQVFAETAEHNVGVGEAMVDRALEIQEVPRANLYVLAAGVSVYRDPSLNLNKPAINARRIADALADHFPSPNPSRVSVLTDAMVTPVAWRSAIQTLVARLKGNVSPDDVVLIYLTGHGLVDPITQEYHFVTSRASIRDLRAAKYEDCLSLEDLGPLRDVGCRKLVILDTCHSGAAQQHNPSRLKQAVRALQNDQMFVLTASDGNQLAFEDAFADPLIQALDGQADTNKDRLVSLSEAFRFVKESMRGQVKPQSPTLGPIDLLDFANFPIARTSPTRTVAHLDATPAGLKRPVGLALPISLGIGQ